MVMAAGLGTRLRPLTYEVAKPMVPIANRPVVEHLLRLLASHGFGEVIANLHWFPSEIESALGDGSQLGVDLTYRREQELLGTAGGVRNVADFLTTGDSDSFVVLAGDALTDVDLAGLVADHERSGAIATLAVKPVADVTGLGVVVADTDGRIQGFQEKPDPDEALSDLVSCMIYVFRADVLDYFPDRPVLDWAKEIFPILLENDAPMRVHRIDAYWNDVGSIPEYLRGNLDAVAGRVSVDLDGELLDGSGDEEAPAEMPGGWSLSGRALVHAEATIGDGARFDGAVIVGPGAEIGRDAGIKDSVILPRAAVPDGALVAGAIVGARGGLAGT
jgi:mannose-1-phosphate guanylyltransferase